MEGPDINHVWMGLNYLLHMNLKYVLRIPLEGYAKRCILFPKRVYMLWEQEGMGSVFQSSSIHQGCCCPLSRLSLLSATSPAPDPIGWKHWKEWISGTSTGTEVRAETGWEMHLNLNFSFPFFPSCPIALRFQRGDPSCFASVNQTWVRPRSEGIWMPQENFCLDLNL